MYYGKVRGQKRRLKGLLSNIEKFVAFTETDCKFEHFHVPCTPWIEQPKTSGKIKTEFCKKWIKKAEEFISKKPVNLPFCKVVAGICYPNLWDSQIIIFYDEDYYKSFWDRKGPYQTWTLIDKEYSFAKARGIVTELKEIGYIERIADDEYRQKSFIWFYGEYGN